MFWLWWNRVDTRNRNCFTAKRGINVGDVVYSVDTDTCYTIDGTVSNVGSAVYVGGISYTFT